MGADVIVVGAGLAGLVSAGTSRAADPGEVRIRVAGRTTARSEAARIGREVSALWLNGPAEDRSHPQHPRSHRDRLRPATAHLDHPRRRTHPILMRLHDIAHSRAGDKGDTSDISVIAYRPEDYELLRTHLTAQRVADHFHDITHGTVDRYEIPQLFALKFVLHHALGIGVNRSLNLDAHGKALSSALLALEQ
jgi:hypothetical protein